MPRPKDHIINLGDIRPESLNSSIKTFSSEKSPSRNPLFLATTSLYKEMISPRGQHRPKDHLINVGEIQQPERRLIGKKHLQEYSTVLNTTEVSRILVEQSQKFGLLEKKRSSRKAIGESSPYKDRNLSDVVSIESSPRRYGRKFGFWSPVTKETELSKSLQQKQETQTPVRKKSLHSVTEIQGVKQHIQRLRVGECSPLKGNLDIDNRQSQEFSSSQRKHLAIKKSPDYSIVSLTQKTTNLIRSIRRAGEYNPAGQNTSLRLGFRKTRVE